MDMMPVNIVCVYMTWSVAQSFLVAGSPFKQPPAPYPTPRFLPPRPTVHQSGSVPDGQLSSFCPSPLPILNRSMPCDQSHLPRLEMSDDILKQVLTEEGGNYVTDYMAISDEEAQENFKNLISLNDLYEDTDFEAHPPDWTWDYSLTKRALLAQLDAAYKEYYSNSNLPESDNGDTHPLNERELWRVYNGDEKVTGGTENENVDYPESVLQNSDRWREIRVNIPLHILAKVFPAQYVYPEHRRTRRSADGTTSEMEYCQNLGSQTSDGYYYLCSSCAHTTTLGPDYYPRIINEAWCNTDSKGCMHVGETAHGSCRQTVFYMTMLRKKQNSCMTVLKDGVRYITDEWEKYAQPFKLGCQCMIDKRSPFAKYVTPHFLG